MCESKMSKERPKSFLYLSMMAELLYREMEERTLDFQAKTRFYTKQDQKCLDNFKELSSMEQLVGSLKSDMLMLEIDLEENETSIMEAEKIVSRLEKNCQMAPPEAPKIRLYPYAGFTFMNLLEQFLATNTTVDQCNKIHFQIQAFNQEAEAKLTPNNVGIRVMPTQITRIIKYHLTALEPLEKRVKHVKSHVKNVESEFEKLKKAKFTDMCPCKPIAVIKPLDIFKK